MGSPTTLDQVATLADQLPAVERLRLIERIVHDLAANTAAETSTQRHDWMAVRGIAPGLLGGEDAQDWVSRSRREGDEERGRQWRPAP